jgi:uncharacterized protein (TIGR03000 family)
VSKDAEKEGVAQPAINLAAFTQKETNLVGVRGKLVVALPAGARLFVDDQAVPVRAGETTFRTPRLGEEDMYFYDLRAELDRDGETVRETTRVVVRPGREAWVSFPQLEK